MYEAEEEEEEEGSPMIPTLAMNFLSELRKKYYLKQ